MTVRTMAEKLWTLAIVVSLCTAFALPKTENKRVVDKVRGQIYGMFNVPSLYIICICSYFILYNYHEVFLVLNVYLNF